MKDSHLVKQAQEGNREAFAQLIDRHLKPSFGVAIALLGNENDAEELLQQSIVEAWQGIGRLNKATSFGAWLAQILRHHAARKSRDSKRAQSAARNWAIRAKTRPTEDDMVDQRAHLERLDQSLQQLPEKLRLPLVLYYYEQKSTRHAAERLGITPATFRKRLQIARDQLRNQLAREWEQHFLARQPRPEFTRSIQSLLLTLPAHSSLTATQTVGVSLGGLLLKKIIATAFIILSLGALLVWWIEPFSDSLSHLDDPSQNSLNLLNGRLDIPEHNGSTLDSPIARQSAEPINLPVTETISGSAELVGTILDVLGEVVEDATVHLYAHGAAIPELSEVEQQLAVSSAGNFFADIHQSGTYSLTVRAKGYLMYWVEKLPLQVGEKRWVTVRLEKGLNISGVVIDPDGNPAANSEIHIVYSPQSAKFETSDVSSASIVILTEDDNTIRHLATTTNQDGFFVLSGLKPGAYNITAQHPLWATAAARRVIAGTSNIKLQLQAGGELFGQVLSPSGQAVENVMIRTSSWDDRSTTSDRQGRFQLPGLREGVVDLELHASGFPTLNAQATIVAKNTSELQLFTLQAGAKIQGSVILSSGERATEILIKLATDYQTIATGQVDENGSFEFDAVPTTFGDLELRLLASEHLVKNIELELTAGELLNLGEISLSSGHYIEGWALDAHKMPLEGVEIMGRSDSSGFEMKNSDSLKKTYSQKNGSFRIGPFASGLVNLSGRLHRYATFEEKVQLQESQTNFQITLGQGRELSVLVTDEAGSPLTGVSAICTSITNPQRAASNAITDDQGLLIIRGLDEEYTLSLHHDFFTSLRQEFTGDTKTVLSMQRTGTIQGFIRSKNGDPIPQFKIVVFEAQRLEPREFILADIDGHFSVSRLDSGTLSLRIEADGYAPFFESSIALAPGQNLRFDAFLQQGLHAKAVVQDSSGLPISGVKVFMVVPPEFITKKSNSGLAIISTRNGGVRAMEVSPDKADAVSDKEGRFSLNKIQFGQTKIRLSHRNYLTQIIDINSPESIIMLRDGARLTGTVLLPDGSPCTGGLITIKAVDIDGFENPLPVSIATDGSYTIGGLPLGPYKLNVIALIDADGAKDFHIERGTYQDQLVDIREELAHDLDFHCLPVPD